MKTLNVDSLIIGTGLAGCAAALELSDRGKEVMLVTRATEPSDTATACAQGGVAYRAHHETPEAFMKDILGAGNGLCFEPAVRSIVTEGPELVEKILLDRLQVPFDQSGDGSPHLTEEGAHIHPRVLHVGDHTGKQIEQAFLQELRKSKYVTFLTGHTAVDLLTLSHHSERTQDIYEPSRCVGAYFFDQQANEVIAVLAKETILATGGLGQLYVHTTNPPGARGDGLAMAYRTGARIMNLEYIQFHPTALYRKTSERFLITEAMRGEGGKLRSHSGEEFMARYDDRGSLAPRDIVARAMHDEMLRNGVQWLYLDISHKDGEWIRARFPKIYAECMKQKIDITKDPIPVVPAAHYSCGGVAVDLDGSTTIRNLKAAGEVACTGVHGANRLASVSLLESLVWGVRAGRKTGAELEASDYIFPPIRPWRAQKEPVDTDLLNQDWLTIKHTMWNYVGLVRTPKRLERAHRIISGLSDEIEKFYAHAAVSDELVGLRHAIAVAQLVLTAARRSRQSVGCHFVRPD